MKVRAWVEHEIEVDISASDAVTAIMELEEPDILPAALSGISASAGFLKRVPDVLIARMSDKQREIILAELEEQAARYKTPKLECENMKALFIPLKTEYYEAFSNGSKREELRRYGSRWNEKTCTVGRPVILSKDYGKQSRMTGRILKFKRQHGTTFGSTYRADILDVFGTLDIEIACVAIEMTPNADVTGLAPAQEETK